MNIGWNTLDWHPFVEIGLLELPRALQVLHEHSFGHFCGAGLFPFEARATATVGFINIKVEISLGKEG